jgi:hypothetical protein
VNKSVTATRLKTSVLPAARVGQQTSGTIIVMRFVYEFRLAPIPNREGLHETVQGLARSVVDKLALFIE